MRFRYEGHDRMGRPLRGEFEAATIEAASAKLREDGVFALKLEQATSEPMRTILEHGVVAKKDERFVSPDSLVGPADAGSVEEEVERCKEEMDEDEKKPGPGLASLEDEVAMAVAMARRIRAAIVRESDYMYAPDRCNEFEKDCLREMLAEIAIRRFRES